MFDSVILSRGRSYIGIVVGDCVPLVLTCEAPPLIGLVHIGLPGAVWRILEVVAQAAREFGARFRDCRFLLGPAIGPDEYNLSSSALWTGLGSAACVANDQLKSFLEHKGGGLFFDLPAMVTSQLSELGAKPDRIKQTADSTSSSDSVYFSNFGHKHLGQSRGRFMALVGPQ